MKKFLTSPVPYMVTAIAIITFWGGQQFAQKRMALDRVRADQATIARLRSDQEARPDPWCEGRGFKQGFECEGMRAIILHRAEEEASRPTPPAKRAAKLPRIAQTSGTPPRWLDDDAVKPEPDSDLFQGKRIYWNCCDDPATSKIIAEQMKHMCDNPNFVCQPNPWYQTEGVWVETPGGSLKFVRVEAPRKP